jgi:hypothetical protein
MSLFYNKSVFNWTSCQLLYSRKNPIVWKNPMEEHILDTNAGKQLS